MLPAIVLKENEERRIRAGHLWVFSNEIASIEGGPLPGDKVMVKNAAGKLSGVGFFNPSSLISVRILAREPIEINKDFFVRKIERALSYRKSLYQESDSFRLIYGESDGMPGLIVDKYGQYLVVQSLCLGMDKLLPEVCDALKEVLSPLGILERSDSPLRNMENLKESVKLLSGEVPQTVVIEEDGMKFSISLWQGQKTGFYFDQRENRNALAKYAQGRRVLDCFCYAGAFSVALARAGAVSVVGVDSSQDAIGFAESNARSNGVGDKCRFIKSDAMSFLEASADEFDIIVLDPPSYARSRQHIPRALRSYVKLNDTALGRLAPHGLLASASCSHHISREAFRECLADAGRRAERYLKILEWHTQAKDHPVLLAMPETEYLKFAILAA